MPSLDTYTNEMILGLLVKKHKLLFAAGNHSWCSANETVLDLVSQSPRGTFQAKLRGKDQSVYLAQIGQTVSDVLKDYQSRGLTKLEAIHETSQRLQLS